ncbi:glucose-6-phosphate isomerase [Sphingomonas mesophila]|uniref:glucose-6-phosphate isomerase n=1 Tax=Sphingomonas mesophila TaxID=2303576 RepID=UPI000E574E7F|nr:glucose-6-phosphate isomerase [Sphingomonas mesophila]
MPATTDPFARLRTLKLTPLDGLFAGDEERVETLSVEVAGIRFDWSKTHLDAALLGEFAAIAEAQGLAARREALFSGEVVNVTEGRAATHVAERGQGDPDHVAAAAASHQRMRSLIDAIEGGAFGDVSGILHIGIGGSALGPELLLDSLGRGTGEVGVSILSNIDGLAVDDSTDPLDPETTLVCAVSKTFTTAETLMNLEAALKWMREAGVEDPYGRVIAITANPAAAIEFGIDETRILPFDEGVGGRYSLWSSVGFSAALALGWETFEELLEGAAAMDRHFRLTPLERNAPVLAAFADLAYTQVAGAETRAVFAYDERLRLLPSYLQQLEMESNGKSVNAAGEPLAGPSAAITWGGTGTDAQHAVFQLLHQGTHLVPVEFVAVIERGDDQDPAHHRALLRNCFAQGAALMAGEAAADPARAFAGNRPSSTILLDRLDARTLGALLAFYEHRVFAAAVLLGINPFDQFGVELGKKMARALDNPEAAGEFDASTRALIERAGL